MQRRFKKNDGGSKAERSALKVLMTKNVSYRQGIPSSVQDLEKVYILNLVSAQTSSTLVSGTKATSTSLDPTARIDNWASRWGTAFKQYCVLSVHAVSSIQATNGGSAANGQIWQRVEEASAAPDGGMVRAEKLVLSLHAPSDDLASSGVITWRPTSSEDLEFISTSTGYAMAYLKTYADPTNTGTSASDSSSQIVTLIYYRIAFRYLG